MGMPPPLPGTGESWALFLDIDGTLLPIAPTPHTVRVEPALLSLLTRLRRDCDGALALVSGRTLADIDTLFAPLELPAAGLHGLERRRADGNTSFTPTADAAIEELRPLLEAYVAARPGLFCEDKGRSIALHYRLAPRYGAAACRFVRRLAAERPQLRLIEGRKVLECVPRGTNKGVAIAAFLAEPPFLGRRPVYAGDDTTDEDGFAAVNAMGGLSIRVADGSSARERRTDSASVARHCVPSVTAFHLWLEQVADRLQSREAAVPARRSKEGGTGTIIAR